MAFTLYYQCFSVYSILSTLLYILFLSSIIRFRHSEPFNSSFFKLCFNLGIIDLMSLVNCWVLHRFPSFGWFGLGDLAHTSPSGLLSKAAVMIAFLSAGSQYFSIAAMAFNRLTALVFIQKHDLVRLALTITQYV